MIRLWKFCVLAEVGFGFFSANSFCCCPCFGLQSSVSIRISSSVHHTRIKRCKLLLGPLWMDVCIPFSRIFSVALVVLVVCRVLAAWCLRLTLDGNVTEGNHRAGERDYNLMLMLASRSNECCFTCWCLELFSKVFPSSFLFITTDNDRCVHIHLQNVSSRLDFSVY